MMRREVRRRIYRASCRPRPKWGPDRRTDHCRTGDPRRTARRQARALMAEYRARIEGTS